LKWPNIAFVRIPTGQVAVQARDIEAVRWVLLHPPDVRFVPLIITRELGQKIEADRRKK
jgi:hypothetical protein